MKLGQIVGLTVIVFLSIKDDLVMVEGKPMAIAGFVKKYGLR